MDAKLRVLVIGMNPSNKPTLGNTKNITFRRLEYWMDKLNIHHFSFINTFDSPGKPHLNSVEFDKLKIACSEYRLIIALGSFVSNALNKINVIHFALPHPSPLNRLLNDKSFEEKILKNCMEYLKK